MAARYKSVIQAGGKVSIPVEICNREDFMLKKGIHLNQSLDNNCIILYRPSGEAVPAADSSKVDSGYMVTLQSEYLEQLSMKEGQQLYFSVVGDLIVIEKERCEKCGANKNLVEYMPCHFRCTECIAYTIHWENEHKR